LRQDREQQVALLHSADPVPVEWVNRDSDAAVLLLCEHAGNTVPKCLNKLGLSSDHLNAHIGVDIGAAAVAREIADLLDAPLILQRYSRLVIDCNRPPEAIDSIPEVSDGIAIPGNHNLSANEKHARKQEIFSPLDQAIRKGLEKFQRQAVFSIHSFTPQLSNQPLRAWHAGFLNRTNERTGHKFVSHISAIAPELNLALNQPYSISSESDWFIPQHAEPRGLRHCLIEIRNDQLQDNDGISFWADLLASAIRYISKEVE